jgi:hypothetical protein
MSYKDIAHVTSFFSYATYTYHINTDGYTWARYVSADPTQEKKLTMTLQFCLGGRTGAALKKMTA